MNKKASICIVLIMIITSVVVFSACNKEHIHTYGDWTIDTQPTCTVAGVESRTCTVCEEKEEKAIAVTGHIYGDWTIDTQPTCTVAGEESRICFVCKEKEERKIVATGKHIWGDFIEKASTCLVAGEKRYNCVNCEEVKIESLPLIEHTYQDVWSKDRTNHWKQCTECATAKDTIEHTMENGKCTVCGFGVTEGLVYRKIEGVEEYAVINIGTATDSEIVIPSTYNGLPVTVIGQNAFNENSTIISVNIPNSIKEICESAFSMCANLKTINIPNSVINIGELAFALCEKLNIYLEEGNSVYHMEGNCLIDTDKKTIIYAGKNSIIPTDGSVTIIGTGAFIGDNIPANVVIPAGITTIKDQAFAFSNSIISITIPKSVTSIGSFGYCKNLASIIVEEGNTNYYSEGNCLIERQTKTLLVGCYNSTIPTDGSVTNIGNNAFAGLLTLTTITIPEGVTSIGTGAFSYSTELETLYIPNSITSIGKYALEALYTTTIYYNGTKAQWTALVDNTAIAFESAELNIQCSDGKWERNTTM